MDPTDANHLITGGESVLETTSGPRTTEPIGVSLKSTDTASVYDTGSGNSITAIGVRGSAVYVGYCGYCYIPSTVTPPFASALATNVGGSKPPKSKTKDGWHKAAAKGLPQRWISKITVDPVDPKTIYVAMGNYDPGIDYRPPGAFGDPTAKLGRPGIYKSTDEGNTFTDISGNLPSSTANWVDLRGGQLIAATNLGVYLSSNLNGGTWSLLGPAAGRASTPAVNQQHFGLASQVGVTSASGSLSSGALPVTPVMSAMLVPGNNDKLFAATYGRSLWMYTFPPGTFVPHPGAGKSGNLATTGGRLLWPALGLLALLCAGFARRVRTKP